MDDDDDNRWSNICVIDEHRVSGFCCYRVTDVAQYQTPPYVYSVMDKFYEHVMSESAKINEIMSEQVSLRSMSVDEMAQFHTATECANCRLPFTDNNPKVIHHSHVTGQYLFAACNKCNLQLKPRKCSANSYMLPIVMHNLRNYDAHFVIKYF